MNCLFLATALIHSGGVPCKSHFMHNTAYHAFSSTTCNSIITNLFEIRYETAHSRINHTFIQWNSSGLLSVPFLAIYNICIGFWDEPMFSMKPALVTPNISLLKDSSELIILFMKIGQSFIVSTFASLCI